MKIIHLSDTHVGHADNASRFAHVIEDIARLPSPENYLVVHTGDLIDCSAPTEMASGRRLLERLTENGFRVLLCPGNHDYGNALKVDKARAEIFRREFSTYIFGREIPTFPVLTRVGNCALIGLDSSVAEFGWLEKFMAEGHLGSAQLLRLNSLLDQLASETPRPLITLYLHHHPFIDGYAVRPDVDDAHFLKHMFAWYTRPFRRLKDAYSLLQCIRDRVDLLLFGHQHYGLDHRFEANRYGIGLALDASSTTCTEMDTDRMRYRIIDSTDLSCETRFVRYPPVIP